MLRCRPRPRGWQFHHLQGLRGNAKGSRRRGGASFPEAIPFQFRTLTLRRENLWTTTGSYLVRHATPSITNAILIAIEASAASPPPPAASRPRATATQGGR